jgi:phasin family protein
MATAKTPKSTPSSAAKEAAAAPAPVETIEAAPEKVTQELPQEISEAEPAHQEHASSPDPVTESEPAFVEPIATLVPAAALQPDIVYAALPAVEDLLDFGKANVEAVMATGQHLAHGLQHLTQSLITWSQDSLQKSLAASQALAGVSSVEDAVALSQKAAQQSLEDLLAEGNHLTSFTTKLLEEAFAPLQSRVKAAVEKITKIAA